MSNPELFTEDHIKKIAEDLKLAEGQVRNTVALLLEDCTIPFIARYRKERTGDLDEVQIRDIRDAYEYRTQLAERKAAVLRSIDEQGKLTPDLKAKIEACSTKTLLEDIYLPYKPKKRTRGQIAKELGLEPLALRILEQKDAIPNGLANEWQAAVALHADLKGPDDVRKGVRDYIAESISEVAELRQDLRTWIFNNASYRSVVKEEFKDKKTKYTDYYDFTEPVSTIAPHRLMALRRAEKEGVIRVTLAYEQEIPLGSVERATIHTTTEGELRDFLKECCKDAFDRILSTTTETEIRLESKTQAEEDAIRVFSKNLRNLLLLPPIPSKTVLGIDPGIRTGSKLVVVDQTGKLLEHDTIYPVLNDLASPKNASATQKILGLIRRHGVSCISIGNGTGSREVADLVQSTLEKEKLDTSVKLVIVNESGASVYSASDLAREEFPDLDVTFRGSVSIARRLQDPLAEFVKIDPKSIGVGQYQHDVNQTRLKKSLSEVVESCVNYVGVNLNTASASLLSYVAGIGPHLARSIVKAREQSGAFRSRTGLLDIQGFGPKAFQQSAGFLRIPSGEHPLDATAVHPESYPIVERMAQTLSLDLRSLVGNKEALQKLKIEDFVSEDIGLLTLKDILNELRKPGRDPREDGASQLYSRSVRTIADLKTGQVLDGTVTNVTNFGAFVDIGVHQDGLVHVSELSTDFVKDASESIAVGERIKVMVIGVDLDRKRISLSRKACLPGGSRPDPSTAKETPRPRASDQSRPKPAHRAGASAGRPNRREQGPTSDNQSAAHRSHRPPQKDGRSRHGGGPAASSSDPSEHKMDKSQKPASLADLMAKFNSKKV